MKSISAILLGLLLSFSAAGQGRVQFANNSSTLILTNNLGNSGAMSGAGNYVFGLYLGTAGTAEFDLTLNILATNTGLAGRLVGSSSGTSPLQTPYADGSNYPLTFQIRGWSSQGGTLLSYEAAHLAQLSDPSILTGRSILGSVSPTFSPAPTGTLFGTSGGGPVPGFVLVSIPEPGTWSLALLAASAALLFRRRCQARKR